MNTFSVIIGRLIRERDKYLEIASIAVGELVGKRKLLDSQVDKWLYR